MLQVTPFSPEHLDEAAALIAGLQVDARHHIAYLGTEPAAVRRQLEALDAEQLAAGALLVDDWIRGVLVPEWNIEPPRVWWHGPFTDLPEWQDSADRLYAAARAGLPAHVTQEELAADAAHVELAAFAARHGFAAEVGSLLLTAIDLPVQEAAGVGQAGVDVALVSDEVPARVAALHDQCFPGSHRVGSALLGDEGILLVAREGQDVVGYARAELEADRKGYLDFIGVDPGARRQGVAARLVAAVSQILAERGATTLHLTVRQTNVAAAALYRRLGFTEERVLVPYRKGWSLGAEDLEERLPDR